MEKKKIYITIFILVFIILLIIIGFAIFKKKSPADDKSLLTQIQRFMNILNVATENWFCVSDQNTLKTIEDTYSIITTSYGKISSDLNIDPALTQAYNTLVNTYSTDMKTILTLPFCSDYCNEAKFDPSKNICVCASGLTPIESGSKVYCSTQDCSSMTNSHFDTTAHSCICNTGYQFNSDNTQCLYTNDELLKQYTQQLNDNLQKLETLIFNKPSLSSAPSPPPPPPPCVPYCPKNSDGNQQCNVSDGCKGICSCSPPFECENNECVCDPAHTCFSESGFSLCNIPDGCGGTCSCNPGMTCNNGVCLSA